MPTTPPDALVRALELEGGSPTRSPRERSPDASSPASAFSARSEKGRRALSPHATISKMAEGSSISKTKPASSPVTWDFCPVAT